MPTGYFLKIRLKDADSSSGLTGASSSWQCCVIFYLKNGVLSTISHKIPLLVLRAADTFYVKKCNFVLCIVKKVN